MDSKMNSMERVKGKEGIYRKYECVCNAVRIELERRAMHKE